MNLDRLIRLALGACLVALAGHWWLPAGLVLGLLFVGLLWSAEERRTESLLRFVQRLDAGDYAARVKVGANQAPNETELALETLGRGLAERSRDAEESQRRLLTALNGMREGVALCDPDGAVLIMNPAFKRLAGFEEPVARRYFLWEAVRDPELNGAVQAVLEGRRGRSVDLPLDGGRLDGRALVTPIDSVAGSSGGAVILLFDRTEERKVERLRSEFVANVSHELRTPLAAVKAALETLQDGAVDDPAVNRRFLEKAIRHGERLEELLSDLLTLSQIEEQRRRGLRPDGKQCRVQEAWADAEALLENALRSHQSSVQTQWAPDLPALNIPSGGLRQILVNYVENALKHSNSAEPVQVGALYLPAEKKVEVYVQDRGQGIPAEDAQRVFERFFRVDKARTRVSGGSGLGLAIVKHLAENAGGSAGVDSAPGKGSRFWVRIPALVTQP